MDSGSVIDLLAEDKKTRELVGFELKAEQADDKVVGQQLVIWNSFRGERRRRAGRELDC